MGERIRCRKCGNILQSKYRHDFQMCKCGSCYIDGGNDYCRVGGEKEKIKSLCNIQNDYDRVCWNI